MAYWENASKSSQFQSFNQEPSVAEVIDCATNIEQNKAMHSLAQHKLAPPPLSNGKKTLATCVNHTVSCDYKYPSYRKFEQNFVLHFREVATGEQRLKRSKQGIIP